MQDYQSKKNHKSQIKSNYYLKTIDTEGSRWRSIRIKKRNLSFTERANRAKTRFINDLKKYSPLKILILITN